MRWWSWPLRRSCAHIIGNCIAGLQDWNVTVHTGRSGTSAQDERADVASLQTLDAKTTGTAREQIDSALHMFGRYTLVAVVRGFYMQVTIMVI